MMKKFLASILLAPAIACAAAPSVSDKSLREAPPTQRQRADGWYRPDGVATQLHAPAYRAAKATPEAMAREYVEHHLAALGLSAAQAQLLQVTAVNRLAAVTVVRLQQRYAGLPVFGSDIAVSMTDDGNVVYVSNQTSPLPEHQPLWRIAQPQLSQAQALTAARRHLQTAQLLSPRFEETVYVPAGQAPSRAWQVEGRADDGRWWQLLVDQRDGKVLRAQKMENDAIGTGGTGHAAPAQTPAVRADDQATGRGYVFDPDPLSSTRSHYGAPGYVNNHDQDSPQLKAARVQVPLPGLGKDINGKYQLVGPWAHCVAITDYDSCPHEAAPVFEYTRDNPAFEAVNVYFHIDRMMRYINQTLGLAIRPYQYAGGVQYDPHGWRDISPKDGKIHTSANAAYLGGTDGRIKFGGGTAHDAISNLPDLPDFGEDGLFIIHELGHGLFDWASHGNASDQEGLNEGVGDYFAAGYVRDHGHWRSGDPEYHRLFFWSAAKQAGFQRAIDWNVGRRYPGDVKRDAIAPVRGFDPHLAGQYWSSCNMVARDAIGGAAMDKAMLLGLAMLGRQAQQNQAAQAVLTAATALHYAPEQLDKIWHAYNESCNYQLARDLPPPEISGATPGQQIGCDYRLDLDQADPHWLVSLPLKDGDDGKDLRFELSWSNVDGQLGGPAGMVGWPALAHGRVSWNPMPLPGIVGPGNKILISYSRGDRKTASRPLVLCPEGKSLPSAYVNPSDFVGRFAVDVGNYINPNGLIPVRVADNGSPGGPPTTGELLLEIVDPQTRQVLHQYRAAFRREHSPDVPPYAFPVDIPYVHIGPYSGKLLRLSYTIGDKHSRTESYPIIGRMPAPGLLPVTVSNDSFPEPSDFKNGVQVGNLQAGDQVTLHWALLGQKPIVAAQSYTGSGEGQLRFATPALEPNFALKTAHTLYHYSIFRVYYEISRQGRTLLSPSRDFMRIVNEEAMTVSR
ncbi:hypothetical protein CXB49_22900 [Chromobacterium sp. ATCC 53434]|uniref:hypothetical protein n=1 Tax=Chromobacterium sp. (strain ATCC 53434 / SC 14030) TaxID=2059672 RepID=UPI000C77D15A|nr:hypothetical protein [Chromobacterium sp. ATCC 53434]AUH53424.1 hypothetical protein CXB49_22900 [Chromobacterium sp. ATCC 53434]